MSEKFTGIYLDESLIHEFHLLALKERKKLKELHKQIVEDYVKAHKDGNPQFKITQFEDPNFIACPAFYRDAKTWENYIKNAEPKEREKLKQQIILLDKKLGMYL